MVDSVIRVVGDATQGLEQLIGRCGDVSEKLREQVRLSVTAVGDGSASSGPADAASLADASAAALDESAQHLLRSIDSLKEYLDLI